VHRVTRRIVLITEIIAPYRIPVFNALAARAEVDLHVIFLAETDPTQRQWEIYTEEMKFSYQVLRGLRGRVRRHTLLLNWGVENALRHASPDAIVCGGYNYFASWTALRWAERNQVRFHLWVESTAQDFRGGRGWMESLKSNFVSRCAGFIVPGKASSRYLGSYGVPAYKMSVAPNAVDNLFFEKESAAAQKNDATLRLALGLPPRYFLFSGRLVPEKGIFDLLRAYSVLSEELKREVGLVFVGDGPARSALVRESSHSSGTIVFAGFAQRVQLAAYYGLADALVFPTHTDPWGLVVNEAMACGLPVICSDAAGCAEDLVHKSNGRIFPRHDVAGLAEAITELASDGDLRRRMGQNSRQIIARCSPEICAAGIAEAVFAREAVAA
jgi:glycosyltransferase involved in cell wall biosynthesis